MSWHRYTAPLAVSALYVAGTVVSCSLVNAPEDPLDNSSSGSSTSGVAGAGGEGGSSSGGTPVCGNGVLESGEPCDDGNTTAGDGCNDGCQREPGFSCEGEPSLCTTICGDGIVAGDEGCDDQSTEPGDGCDDACQVEEGWVCEGEPSSCTPLATCGDGIVDDTEGCDDDNTEPNDGCGPGCQPEPGFGCDGEPSFCTPICGDTLVVGNEVCDDGNTNGMVITPAVGGDFCAADCLSGVAVVFGDDMESGPGGWTHSSLTGGPDPWNLSNLQIHSPSTAWHSGTTTDNDWDNNTRLVSPIIDLTSIPSGPPITLTFWHFYRYDDCGDPTFQADGHYIEISANNGPFQLIDPIGGYPVTLACGCGYYTSPGYGHNSGDVYQMVSADLSPYAGSVVRIGFSTLWDCGNCDEPEGLFLDDVIVTYPLPPP